MHLLSVRGDFFVLTVSASTNLSRLSGLSRNIGMQFTSDITVIRGRRFSCHTQFRFFDDSRSSFLSSWTEKIHLTSRRCSVAKGGFFNFNALKCNNYRTRHDDYGLPLPMAIFTLLLLGAWPTQPTGTSLDGPDSLVSALYLYDTQSYLI